ncbi:2-keto-4-pentenoate hydratase/2-oxohepta-3-ene-1,7-dioic acid hydratase (catechol pathway) [Robiginitalea myxolifaciens]|uniref:2-keto-4-pentenoate hydratase/2-oxohepta-3-ene-1,7-dioic acid hydratase (Catechol pathway) n=1 Tax=Robiginitalea myxolifaciens TaxID=400055 RepID=A0A1I6FNT9_9FLAO|nr:fumarylacetoacetate hydrolase family protein [Robiginitalea myxolifaciens]SFR31534.1 2-keto-4-pentenoate hydratase/2-oxohepta-3-ene-1,7-dioic acid hydratase (catechol pathway) [Robiginitalea myxolifaciens]
MKLICVGRNYADHITELSNERPKDPVLFIKPDSAILPREQDFYIPEFSNEIHHEIEVLLRICKVGKHIAPEFAHTYYDAITVGLDFTARDLQQELKQKGLPWEKAKGFDGAAVIGNWVPAKRFTDHNSLNFELQRNGEVVQSGNTNSMLWGIDQLIAYVSTFFTLKKGDILFTGTPAGVGRVASNDYLVGSLEGETMFSLKVK